MNIEHSYISKLSDAQVDNLLDMYKNETWCNQREKDDVVRMLENSWITAIVNQKDGQLIAFARVLSDFVYRAFIYDVIVAQEYRGLGFGEAIVKSILEHSDFKQVERIELNCIDRNVAFYNKFGFETVPNGTNLMRYSKS